MAEPSSSSKPDPENTNQNHRKVTIIGPNPEKYRSQKSKGKSALTYDFSFQLMPNSDFVNAIASLVNYVFNPSKMGLMEVDESGFSITVYNFTEDGVGGEHLNVFGLLRLVPSYFNSFDCEYPVANMINLEHVLLSLNTDKDDCFLNVYSATGSNQVTFEFDRAPRRICASGPFLIALEDVSPGYREFPDIVCGTETSVPSSYLTPVISDVLQRAPKDRPDFVGVNIRPSSVKLTMGEETVRAPPEMLQQWFSWPFWETLQTATKISEECFIYMVLEPEESLMMMFKITDPDAPISFKRGTFTHNESLSCLAFLRSFV